jgi:hypothetical protein
MNARGCWTSVDMTGRCVASAIRTFMCVAGGTAEPTRAARGPRDRLLALFLRPLARFFAEPSQLLIADRFRFGVVREMYVPA